MSIKGVKPHKLRELPKGKRFEYFWMYYKYHVFFGLIAAFLLGYTVYGILKPKPDLQVMWLSDGYTVSCESSLRGTLEAMDWDTNGDGKTTVLLTYAEFDTEYSDLSYQFKSEITVLVAGQEYSFFIVNDYAWEWMLENDLAATWREIGVTGEEEDEYIFVPLSEMKAFSGEYTEPLQGTHLCVAQAVQGKEDEYMRQAEALRRMLAEQGVLPTDLATKEG